MTQCSSNTLPLTSLGTKNVTVAFDGGRITSDAGAVLMREADRTLGLLDQLSEAINDKRDQRYVTHSMASVIKQRIHGIGLGYEDLNDHEDMRRDPALKLAAERAPEQQELASPSTLCRMENDIDRESLWKMGETLVDAFIARRSVPPRQLILDVDVTDDAVHGDQEGGFFHGFYNHYCFLPLYIFCGDQLLGAYLRPGNSGPSRHVRAMLKMLVGKLRQAWPEVRIIVRGDSGFCRWRTMSWCERNDVDYIFGIARNEVLTRNSTRWRQEAEEGFEMTGNKQRIFADFEYGAGSWSKQRRVIVKAEHAEGGANPRYIVTSLGGGAGRLYDEIYCQRGEMENRIKEQQLYLFADRTSASEFLVNQLRLLLASAAYVLIEYMRSELLAGTRLARAQADTIRLKLLKIGAQVRESTRRISFHLGSGYPLKDLFRRVLSRARGRPGAGPLLAAG